MRKPESDYNKTMKELQKALKAQDEQLAKVQAAEERYKQDKDLNGYISFWEDIWQDGGLLFKGAFWTFRLADLYIKAKRYDDAIFFCQMVKTWAPDFSYKADKYIEQITEKMPNRGNDRKEVMHMLRQKTGTPINDGANSEKAQVPQKPKKKRGCLTPIIIFLALAVIASFGKTSDKPTASDNQSEPQLPSAQAATIQEPSSSATPTPEETEPPLTIVLTAEERGEYGEIMELNKGTEFEEVYYVYRVPVGTYTITNVGKYMSQFNVYGDTVYKTEYGWDELSDTYYVKLLGIGESDTVTIEDGQIIEIHKPAKFELVKQ